MGTSYFLIFVIFDIIESKSIFMLLWIFIFYIPLSFTMNQSTLFLPRLINENNRVVCYRSESGIWFENRKKVRILTYRNNRIKRLQKRAQQFHARLIEYTPCEKKVKSDYDLYCDTLFASYQETFKDCKLKNNLETLLYEFDIEQLQKDQYRQVCSWLVPAIMAFNDKSFLANPKVDFLFVLHEKCNDLIELEKTFFFSEQGIAYNDSFGLLKLITLYSFASLLGHNTFINNLKERHPHVRFDELNYIDIIAKFDLIAEKRFEILEQQKSLVCDVPRVRLEMSENLKEIQEKPMYYFQWTQELDKVWFVFLYYKYNQIMNGFNSDRVKQEWFYEFWNNYCKKRIFDAVVTKLFFLAKPFIFLFKRFDAFVDKMILKYGLG